MVFHHSKRHHKPYCDVFNINDNYSLLQETLARKTALD